MLQKLFFKEKTYLFTTSFKTLKRINHRGDKQMAQFYISQGRLFLVIISKERAVLVPVLGRVPLGLWNEMNRLHTSSPTTDSHFSMPKLRHAASFYSDPTQNQRWRFDGWVSQETKQSVTSQFWLYPHPRPQSCLFFLKRKKNSSAWWWCQLNRKNKPGVQSTYYNLSALNFTFLTFLCWGNGRRVTWE